jgi:hypothetical protein
VQCNGLRGRAGECCCVHCLHDGSLQYDVNRVQFWCRVTSSVFLGHSTPPQVQVPYATRADRFILASFVFLSLNALQVLVHVPYHFLVVNSAAIALLAAVQCCRLLLLHFAVLECALQVDLLPHSVLYINMGYSTAIHCAVL